MQEVQTTSPPSSAATTNEDKLESQPNLSSEHSKGFSLKERVFQHLSTKVETTEGYIPLLVCCFATGLTDGTVYNGMKHS